MAGRVGGGNGSWSRRAILGAGGALAAGAGIGLAPPAAARTNPRSAPLATAGAAPAQSWHSDLVYPGSDGKLVYESDDENNRIPDFSWAGYANSETELPEVPVVASIGPVSGDNTDHIQQALDEVGEREPDSDGFRGALLLEPGHYHVAGTLRMNRGGVVLRGSGQTVDPDVSTVITATGSNSVSEVILVGGETDDWEAQVPDTQTDIVDDFVQVGSRTFSVADASNLSAGDNLIIFHPHTQEWTDAIDGGGVIDQPPWPVGERPIIYNRYIKEVSGNDITVCAPVFNHLDKSLSQSYVYVWAQSGDVMRNAGVENLRIDMGYPPEDDEDHPLTCVTLSRVEDAWVRDCTLLHFSFAGVNATRATRCTILDVRASHPRSRLEGSRRYNFNTANLSQQILFNGLWATHARHAFVANGTTRSSGNAWVDGFNEEGYSESGGHHRWNHGLLFDNIQELNSNSSNGWVLSLHNRGDMGTGHGWSSVHSVAWNCTVNSGKWVCVGRPPTAQNYAIGTTGDARGENWSDIPNPTGYIEGTNQAGLEPGSLFQAQLDDRLGS